MTYMTGYNGTVRSLESLQAWSQWQQLDAETQRRVLALMDASIVAGRPLGIGNIFRSYEQQATLFKSRHKVDPTGSIWFEGKRWRLIPGEAPAAPPGNSYHEATTPEGKAVAIDFIGDLNFLRDNAGAYGLVHFADVNNEPWHGQPVELPTARRNYDANSMHPLHSWNVPGPPPAPQPTRIFAPQPTLRVGGKNNVTEARALQSQLNFWGWRDVQNRPLVVDGIFGSRSAQAVMSMQRALSSGVDGIYGPKSAARLQAHLDAMVGLSA